MSWSGGDLVRFLLAAVVAVAGSFFLGGVNPAAIFARVLGKDLSAGSGNPGATNAGRVVGRKWGVLVGVLDVLKGVVPVWVTLLFFGTHFAYLSGLAAVLGHVFSPYLRGRGGKGVATALGAILPVHPWYAVALLVVFVLVFAVTRWVALGSMLAAVGLLVIGVLAFVSPGSLARLGGSSGWPTGMWAGALGGIILARHQRNLRDIRSRFPHP
ncbi:MAG TPA: glycerol-3-phosphate acyltransferase [Dermatophilaceae bacterium]|nr:glycerol-3-phosphate acyltransferase [Dermatophilaceae bacterium]